MRSNLSTYVRFELEKTPHRSSVQYQNTTHNGLWEKIILTWQEEADMAEVEWI